MSDEPVKIRVRLSCMFAVNARYSTTFDGPPRSEWEEMTPAERDDYLAECEKTELYNQIEVFAEVVKETTR